MTRRVCMRLTQAALAHAPPPSGWISGSSSSWATNPLSSRRYASCKEASATPGGSEARAAAGGVTAALILPGSANLIGGEGFIVAMRQGRTSDEVAFEGAPARFEMERGHLFLVALSRAGEHGLEARVRGHQLLEQTLEPARHLIAARLGVPPFVFRRQAIRELAFTG